MNFYPYSAIEIPRLNSSQIAECKQLNEFWVQVEDLKEGLPGAIGCYIFSIRASKGIVPWYVGLAEKQSFRKECFTYHKLLQYNKALVNRKGTPLLTLIAKHSPTGKIVNPTGNQHKDVQFLEKMLISSCLLRNPNLRNMKDTKLLREMVVPGLLNTQQGKAAASVSEFRALIGT